MSYNIKLMGLEVKRDGKNIKGSDFAVEIKELDEYKGTFWCVGSAESPDRSKDIIRVEGWDLKNYASNPIGLWCHNYYENPQFKSLKVKKDKDNKQLLFNPQFDMNYEPARTTFNQYKNGFMNMFSVGFIPGEYEFLDEDNKWSGGIDFTKGHELLELSAVPVPAHPNAGIMRGLFNNEKSLIDLGYIPEFKFIEEKNHFWNPININLDAYKDPRMVSVGKGIKALSAASIDPNFKDTIVGYLFDKEEFDETKIKEWTSKNVHTKPLQKFYQINFEKENEESKIILSVLEGEEEKSIEIKAEDTCKCPKCGKTQKPDKGKSCSATNCSTCDVSMEDKVLDEEENIEEEGCGGGKKPKKEIEEEIVLNEESANKEIIIEEKSEINSDEVQLVDKTFLTELKIITEESKKLLEDIKSLLESSLIKQNISPDSEVVVFTFNPLDEEKEVTPVSSNSSNKENDEKITISDEDFKSLSSEEDILNKFDELFNDKFKSVKLLD